MKRSVTDPSTLLSHLRTTRRLLWVTSLVLLSSLAACAAEEDPEGSADTQIGADTNQPDAGNPEDTASSETTDEDVQPDAALEVGEPDPVAVAQAIDAASVQTYRQEASQGGEIDTCAPDQPLPGGIPTDDPPCADNEACDDGFVCRNVRRFALDSRCGCVPAATCDDISCNAGTVCLPGTSSAQSLCGGGLHTPLCNDECVIGACASDTDCSADERCIVVRDVCGYLSGLTCTPTAGTGCLGIAGACGADATCLPTLAGNWSCVSTLVNCD